MQVIETLVYAQFERVSILEGQLSIGKAMVEKMREMNAQLKIDLHKCRKQNFDLQVS